MPLLEIEPPILTFRFELRRRASCTIRLSNNTDQCVVYKVSTKNTDKCFCVFNYGSLLPGSSCLVKVTMHSLTRVPSCKEYKDEICIKSTVATRPDTVESCKKLFKERRRLVEVQPLDLVYVHQSSDFQRRNRNKRHDGNLFKKGVAFILLFFIFGYLVIKMLQFIRIMETLLYRCIDCVAASCETFYELCVRFLSVVFRQR